MTVRALSGLTLAAAVGLAAPWMAREPAAVGFVGHTAEHAAVPQPYDDAYVGLHRAVDVAVRDHVPGIAGQAWTLHRLDTSDPDDQGVRHVVAHGVVAPAGAPGTGVRLSGRYDPAVDRLTQVAYRLAPVAGRTDPAAPRTGSDGPAWSVQQAVQQALSDALPGQDVRFALDSAQSTRLPDGERRFEGSGIGTWDGGEARFVAFSLVLSQDGRPVAFDYGAQAPDDAPPMVAHR